MVILVVMVGVSALLPILSTIIFHFCYHRINEDEGRRVCYGSTIVSFVMSFGLTFLILWQYRYQNAWLKVGQTIVYFLLVMFGVSALNVAVLWYYYKRGSKFQRDLSSIQTKKWYMASHWSKLHTQISKKIKGDSLLCSWRLQEGNACGLCISFYLPIMMMKQEKLEIPVKCEVTNSRSHEVFPKELRMKSLETLWGIRQIMSIKTNIVPNKQEEARTTKILTGIFTYLRDACLLYFLLRCICVYTNQGL